ncbi:MAG TPA: helix-turn-helix domain-containing protein [Roseiarcus sp.]|nr:helix-turn-helix domain-containing protein [Roseiarcus sp.]
MSEVPSKPTTRGPRADAARNRERLLGAAKDVFSAGGPEASLEAVARRAGVGIGTLYRHFPTREALFEAVYRREVDELAALAEALARQGPPAEALRRWVKANVAFVATKKGMAKALALAAYNKDLSAYSIARLSAAGGLLIERAREAGALRTDIMPQEMMRAVFGFCIVNDQPGWRETALKLIDVFLDGLLVGEG